MLFPQEGCTTGTQPDTVNLVVSGISPGEDVFIFASAQKDDPFFAQNFPGARFGSDVWAVKMFNYQSLGIDNSTGIVSVPVNVSDLRLSAAGSVVYLQAAAGYYDPSDPVGYTNIRFSELDEVKSSTAECSYGDGTSYGDNNGGTY